MQKFLKKFRSAVNFTLILLIGLSAVLWFTSNISQSNQNLSDEIRRSLEQEDLSAAVDILDSAIKKYPLAFSAKEQARNLLAKNRLILHDTASLSDAIERAQDDKDPAHACNMLAGSLKKYQLATNREQAETLLKTISTTLTDSCTLAAALANARMMEDASERIKLLEKTLAECPRATDRAEAERVIADTRRQLEETDGLAQAIQQARQGENPTESAKLLKEALGKYQMATNQDAAIELLDNLQMRSANQKDPLQTAILSSKEQDDPSTAMLLLKEAFANNPNSPYRAEAEQLLSLYQHQLREMTAGQKTTATDSNDTNGGYVFLPPEKASIGAGTQLRLYDSPLASKMATLNYGLDVRLRKLDKKPEKFSSQADGQTDALHYVPRLIISVRSGPLSKDGTVVVEYYLADPQDKSELQKATIERITLPAMARGQTVAVDCMGIECRPPEKGVGAKKDPGEKLHGIIVSLYNSDGELLLQRCSSSKLLKECKPQPK